MRKLNECSRASEAERAQRQAMTAERRPSQWQRTSDIAVDDAHGVQTGTGNGTLWAGDGRPVVNTLQNVDVVDVDRAQATDKVTNCASSDDVCNGWITPTMLRYFDYHTRR